MARIEKRKGYCTLCVSRCGTINTIDDDTLLEVAPDTTHPTGSAICAKGRAAPELVHSPARLHFPLRRTSPKTSPDPAWKRISWREALAEIADNLRNNKAKYGAESVAVGVTTPSGTSISDSFDLILRFARLYGTPNVFGSTEICNWHKDQGHTFTFGCATPLGDYRNSEVIILWGHNPANTWLSQASAIAEGRRRGAKLIVVDPRPTALAREADLWLRVRPGTDGALAMGIANVMIAGNIVDYHFVRSWTNAPFLVREDNGLFFRERDVTPAARGRRYAVWNTARSALDFVDGPQTPCADRLALRGTFSITAYDPQGKPTTVRVRPAFDHYVQLLSPFTPETVATITGVPSRDVVRAAELMAPGKRIAYHAWSGVAQQVNATQTERAIATMYALTGAFDTRGSNRLFAQHSTNPLGSYSLLSPQQQSKALGLTDRRLGPAAQGFVAARDLYLAILDEKPYKIRSLISFGANPITSYGDVALAKAAFSSLEFHVHCDLFETPTARYADIVLPINTSWEREGIRVGFGISEDAANRIQLRPRMVSPRGESRADYEVVLELATRLDMSESFFDGNVEAAWDHMLAPTGLDVRTLRNSPGGITIDLKHKVRQYAGQRSDGQNAGFATETRHVELYSELMLRAGYPPLPSYDAPSEQLDQGVSDSGFPYLLTSVKNAYYCHSQHRSLTSLRKRAPYPVVELSAQLAGEKGIAEDTWVVVRTASGFARFRARVVAELSRDVIIAEYGWWQACQDIGLDVSPIDGELSSNFSNVASTECRDPLSGSVILRGMACNIDLDPSVEPAQRGWQGFREFVVRSAKLETALVRAITIAAADGGPLPDHLPGQHISLHIPSLGQEAAVTRAYSLTGPARVPNRRTYSVSVKHLIGTTAEGVPHGGAVSSFIHHDLKIGQAVSARIPSGIFVMPTHSDFPVVLFAGGIGITPFLSYLETVANEAKPPEIRLFYANKNHATHAFRSRIRELGKRIPTLQVIDCYTSPRDLAMDSECQLTGRLSAEVVDFDLIRRRARFYLCGPAKMTRAISAGLIDRGVPRFDIFSEVFRSPTKPQPNNGQKFSVRFLRSKRIADWTPDQGTLLSFAEQLGVSLPSGCRVGQCESCAVRVVSGNVTHLGVAGPDELDMCLACQAIPISAITIDA